MKNEEKFKYCEMRENGNNEKWGKIEILRNEGQSINGELFDSICGLSLI